MAAPDSTDIVSTATPRARPDVSIAQVLVVSSGGSMCSIPVVHVRETMRALPVEPVANVPDFILGLSVIRGAPIPVVDLNVLLANQVTDVTTKRFVTLQLANDRTVAIAVDHVVGVRKLDTAQLEKMPPLLEKREHVIDSIGTADQKLLVVFHASRLIPDAAWTALDLATGRA